MDLPDLFAVTPSCSRDPSIAIAACRAGAIGVLDLEFATSLELAVNSLERLQRFTSSPYGVKLGNATAGWVETILADRWQRMGFVVFAGGDCSKAISCRSPRRQVSVLAEAVTVEEAIELAKLPIDGLILKGNEAGGRIGGESTFVLVQRWRADSAHTPAASLPFWAQGGIGPNSAAACLTGGATGIVIDSQLLLTRESPLRNQLADRCRAFDGSETKVVGEELGECYRLWASPQSNRLSEVQATAEELAKRAPRDEARRQWRAYLESVLACDDGVLLIGQDFAFAAALADRFVTVGGVVREIRDRQHENRSRASKANVLAADSTLASANGTRFPLLQGPMTRVSDTPAFAKAVADEGALPFLAAALLRGPEFEQLLLQTREQLGGSPWGVGILGFIPNEIRREQIDAILRHQPPFCLIAGGRPDQAQELEAAGIATYLHVPSPGLLRSFLRSGAKRFVFEGRECGGHVGPRSCFVLWELVCEVIQEYLGEVRDGSELHAVFAGGIHDSLSSAMLTTLVAPLADRGVKIGALMGTAYLYTKEAVDSGAIVPGFQQEAIEATSTVLLETAPGHAVRCAHTPYCDAFAEERRKLLAAGQSQEVVVRTLELMNLGRLRLAAKGLQRQSSAIAKGELGPVPEDRQRNAGMYMMGQVATLRHNVTTLRELHADVCVDQVRHLETSTDKPVPRQQAQPCDVAIIGMSAFFPDALSVTDFWENTHRCHDAVREVPASHWDWELYYDPDPAARDRIISKWGGFLGDVSFDPLHYGIAPNTIRSIEPLQLLVLESVRRALADAGYDRRPFDRENTCTVLGVGGGGGPMTVAYGLRTCLPMFDTIDGLNVTSEQLLNRLGDRLPEWTEDSFPGILLNVAAGRVANRFDFGGSNYALDAACASSLAAVHACLRELEMGTCNVAVAIGADAVQTPYAYVAFSKTHALSPRGRCAPFDDAADGIVLSEGVGTVILKRLADAEQDGDKIYAVIKGAGSSSDGMHKGLTAPNSAGQVRAIRRAFDKAGFSPATVSLIEAHGTGTVVGDKTEALSLSQVMSESGAAVQSCALGSVKSLIGHTKCAAGIAGLIKTTKALDTRTLPPTRVDKPNSRINFSSSALYLNAEPRPWIHREDRPRRAGVSSFGFGGTNVHLVLEEYRDQFVGDSSPASQRWPAELFVWKASSRPSLLEALQSVPSDQAERWPQIAAHLAERVPAGGDVRLAIVASGMEELREKLRIARRFVEQEEKQAVDARGIYFAAVPIDQAAKVAFLFPGQGSQYPNALSELAMAFPTVRRRLDRAEAVLSDILPRPLSRYLYPPSSFSAEDEQRFQSDLAAAEVAQPAIGACSMAILDLLTDLNVHADLMGGHSYGEFSALAGGGVIRQDDLLRLSFERGELIRQAAARRDSGGMVAVNAPAAEIRELVDGLDEIFPANYNTPTQTVFSGTHAGLQRLVERAKQHDVSALPLPVACAFHSPLVADAHQPVSEKLRALKFHDAERPVYSSINAEPYPADQAAIRDLLIRHLTSPVKFVGLIEAMYGTGARVFLEVGPGHVLTGMVGRILTNQPHLAAAMDMRSRNGLEQLVHTVGRLFVQGVPVSVKGLFTPRGLVGQPMDRPADKVKPSPALWLVNGVRSRPLNDPEPLLLGTREEPRSRLVSGVPKPLMENEKPTTTPVAENSNSGPFAALPAIDHQDLNGHGPEQVMLSFQNVMAQFLETQQAVMLSYLQNGDQGSDPVPPVAAADESFGRLQEVEKIDRTPSDTGAEEAVSEETSLPDSEGEIEGGEIPFIEQIENKLLELVSDRTGYPPEMLDLDLDLEANLGIDSIKRVEILSGLTESLRDPSLESNSQLELEQLTSIRTLRGILEYLQESLFPSEDESGEESTPVSSAAAGEESLQIERGVVELVELPFESGGRTPLLNGAIVLTDDGRGIARAVASRLAEYDLPLALVSMPGQESAENHFAADLNDHQAVAELMGRVRERFGAIAGLLHLLPLAEVEDSVGVAERSRRDVRSLYLLARELEPDLRAAGDRSKAFLLAASALGGNLGYGRRQLVHLALAAHGGILGFIKCVGLEWPDVLVRAVDLDAGHPAGELADSLLSELSAVDGPLEVGHSASGRVTWQPVAAPLERQHHEVDLLGEDANILVLGGARGITARIVASLGHRYKSNFILLGRSPGPAAEDPAMADLTEMADMKREFIRRLEEQGGQVDPTIIERQYRETMINREIQLNLAKIRESGARVQYHSVDVSNQRALAEVINDVVERCGPITGVIHGAGMMEDKLLRDKVPDSFDRVFGVKVEAADQLARLLNPEELRFCVFFASIASRFGNRGQSDYAAANEVLSKMALELDRRWPCRVFSLAWGPWSEIGMAAALEQHLTARGVKMIDPRTGSDLFLDELEFGWKGDSEVLIGGGETALFRVVRGENRAE